VNQEESEQNEVDGMKKGADPTGEVMHISNLSFVRQYLENGTRYTHSYYQ